MSSLRLQVYIVLAFGVLSLSALALKDSPDSPPWYNCHSSTHAPYSDLSKLLHNLQRVHPRPQLWRYDQDQAVLGASNTEQVEAEVQVGSPPTICRPVSDRECKTIATYGDAAVDLCGAEMECWKVLAAVRSIMGRCIGQGEDSDGLEEIVTGGTVSGLEGGSVVIVRKAS